MWLLHPIPADLQISRHDCKRAADDACRRLPCADSTRNSGRGYNALFIFRPAITLNVQTLSLTQPPHQQFFAIGDKVTSSSLQIAYRKAYTIPDAPTADPNFQKPIFDPPLVWAPTTDNGHGAVYRWDNGDAPNPIELRFFLVENLATDYLKGLGSLVDSHGTNYFDDKVVSSAVMGYQCNSPSFQLNITVANMELQEPSRLLPVPVTTPPAPPSPLPRSSSPGVHAIPSPDSRLRDPGTTLPKSHPPPSHRAVRNNPLPPNPHTIPGDGNDSDADKTDSDDDNDGANSPAGYPSFKYHFWAASNPGTLTKPTPVPMNTRVPQDIVFSIVLDKAYNFNLLDLEVFIQTGEANKERTTLTQSYHGPGATMLSNLRFNAHVSFSAKQGGLQVQLKPRSTSSDGVPVARCGSLSFMLSGVDVADNSKAGPNFRRSDGTIIVPITIRPNFLSRAVSPIDEEIVLRDMTGVNPNESSEEISVGSSDASSDASSDK